jgi:hypothetical protein
MTNYNHPGVYINELPLATTASSTEGGSTAAGAMIAQLPQGPSTVTRVTSWYDFQNRFGSFNSAYPATFHAYLFFQNGGDSLYVRRIIDANAPRATVALFDTTSGTALKICDIEAKSKGNDGLNLRIQLSASSLIPGQSGYYDITVTYEAGVADTIVSGVVTAGGGDDVVLEKFYGVSLTDVNSSDFITNVLAFGSSYIRVKDEAVTVRSTPPVLSLLPLTATASTTAVVKGDYTGDTANTGTYANFTVLKEFDVIDQPLIMFAPDVITKLGTTDSVTVYNAMLAWAETGLGYVIVETEKDAAVTAAINWADGLSATSRGAVYYPHFYMKDPLSRSGSAVRRVGPSGAVAGLYLSTDKQAGPFKTPAGISSVVKQAVALERPFTNADLDTLNTGVIAGTYKAPVNAIRNLPGAGIVVMGGRSLLQDGTANRFVNMRRSLIYIEKSLNDLAQFAVFENNTEVLWSQLVTTIGTFLNDYRNKGGLRGATPAEAFYVKCDAENNSNASIANGFVNVEVGVALEYPAEYVVINLSQKTAN